MAQAEAVALDALPWAEEAVERLLEELALPQRGARVDLGRGQQHGALAYLGRDSTLQFRIPVVTCS